MIYARDMVKQPTGAVTFLFTDIEGSTRLWEDRPDEMRQAVERHDQLVNQTLAGHDGYVFSTAGDSFAAAFSSPKMAVAAALSVQQALDSEVWKIGNLKVRMGLHSGIAHERDGDYFGPTLSRAARIMSAGHGGQVLVSHITAEMVEEVLPSHAGLRSLGEFRLKDLGAPERLFQLVHPDLSDDFPPLRTLDNHPTNLPAELSSFIGRQRELADIGDRLQESRLVTLTGVGGAGKTRLALQAAANRLDDFPNGVWVVELASLVDPSELSRSTAQAIGLPRDTVVDSEGASIAAQRLVDYLAPRRSLLVLDNCEHMIGPAAEFADFLLRSCPDLKFLATSREGLAVAGEQLIQVPSLALTPEYVGGTQSSRPADAVDLFTERASSVDSRFELTPENIQVVVEICRRLDGMPLAIELAAARVRLLPPDQILDRLSDAFRLLTGGTRTALPRQQTLRATMDWSYDLLSENERLVFERLAVFRGGFTLDSAEATVSGEGVEEWEVFDMLASLVDKSMVQQADRAGRFSLLETLRQYGLDRLAESASTDRWRRRHAEHYAEQADEAYEATRDHRQAAWLDQIDQDHENFKAAVTWAMDSGAFDLGVRLAIGLWWNWFVHSHTSFGKQVLTALIEADVLAPPQLAHAYHARAWMDVAVDIGSGLEDAERASSISSRLGDDRLFARTSVALVPVLGVLQRHEEEHRIFNAAYEAAQRAGDDWVMGRLALNHGFGFTLRAKTADDPNLKEADRWQEAALRHFRASGVQLGLAHALTQQAVVLISRREYRAAISLFDEARNLSVTLGDRKRAADNELMAATALIFLGRPDDAVERVLAGLSGMREIGGGLVEYRQVLAVARAESGDLAGGIEALGESVDELANTERSVAAKFCIYVARFAIRAGAHEDAAKLIIFAGGDDLGPRYPGHLTDTIVGEIMTSLAEQLPDWRALAADWRDRPVADVIPLLHSVLDDLQSSEVG